LSTTELSTVVEQQQRQLRNNVIHTSSWVFAGINFHCSIKQPYFSSQGQLLLQLLLLLQSVLLKLCILAFITCQAPRPQALQLQIAAPASVKQQQHYQATCCIAAALWLLRGQVLQSCYLLPPLLLLLLLLFCLSLFAVVCSRLLAEVQRQTCTNGLQVGLHIRSSQLVTKLTIQHHSTPLPSRQVVCCDAKHNGICLLLHVVLVVV
jgi:hypothetical protein